MRVALGVILALVMATAVVVFTREPRTDREWDIEVARMTSASFEEDGSVILHDLRDFRYEDGEVTPVWVDEERIRPGNIVRAWFVLEPFSAFEAVGHTFLTFELEDGSAYSFSVEARREKGERYAAWNGLFRAYELAYAWGTERDFLTRRLVYLKHPVRMYPLLLSSEEVQALFMGLAKETNTLAEHPRFYHTWGANCTNVLAELVNELDPGRVPYDISWILPGYSDRFLARVGLIESTSSTSELRVRHDLSASKDEIEAFMTLPHPAFGKALRELIEKTASIQYSAPIP